MKTILVPSDFSDNSLYALKVAASIARKANAEIIIVHCYLFPTEKIYDSYIFEDLYKEMNIMINAQLDSLLSKVFLKGIAVKKHILINMKLSEIDIEKVFGAVDLIVIGSHGKSGPNDFFIGSNTEKVIRQLNIPVLSIKKEMKNFNIKKIVFASNFYGESYSVFEKIKFFTDIYDTQIELLKIITHKNFEASSISRKLMEDFADKFQLSNYNINIYKSSGIIKGIRDFSEEVNADLIAIQTHGRTGFAHLINGSLAEGVALNEDRPVLSVKLKAIPAGNSRLSWYLDKIEKSGSTISANG